MFKNLVIAVIAGFVAGVTPHAQARSGAGPAVQVYKTPTCGCCAKWVDHMRHAGFTVDAQDLTQADLQKRKAELGVPQAANSCHTARVGAYVLEGHIPADVVKRLLKERPKVAGIAVPAMPIGSPGMEVPGTTPQPYDVLSFDKAGTTRVYTTVKP